MDRFDNAKGITLLNLIMVKDTIMHITVSKKST